MLNAEQKLQSSDQQAFSMPRRLSLRGKLLQLAGAALIALAVFIDWPAPSDPSVPQTSSLLLVLGVLVFGAGLVADRRNVPGS
jgi:hypothetical protein